MSHGGCPNKSAVFAACTAHPPSTTGWVENGYSSAAVNYITFTQSTYSYISGQWSVPNAPEQAQGQTLYLFNGLEPANDSCIIQPVLGWNGSFSNSWGIASWICCLPSGTLIPAGGDFSCYYSTPVSVNVGDSITGTTSLNSSTGDWSILSHDNTNGQSTTLSVTAAAAGGAETQAFGGVLEVYNVANCFGYPATSPITFSNTSVISSGVLETPSFVPLIDTNDGCGEGVTTSAGQVSLDIASFTPSANDTVIPPASQIIDSHGTIWTMANGYSYQNGKADGGSLENLMLYLNGNIYVHTTYGRAWEWEGGWVELSSSASGTAITSASYIVDSGGNLWNWNGTFYENGVARGGNYLLLYYNGTIYAENTDSAWYTWTGSGWESLPSGDPRVAGTNIAGGFTLQAGHCDAVVNGMKLCMQTQGNLVLYPSSGAALWATNGLTKYDAAPYTGTTYDWGDCTTCSAAFQTDGNLVLYNSAYNGNIYHAYWASNTGGNSGAILKIFGTPPYVEILNSSGSVIWDPNP